MEQDKGNDVDYISAEDILAILPPYTDSAGRNVQLAGTTQGPMTINLERTEREEALKIFRVLKRGLRSSDKPS